MTWPIKNCNAGAHSWELNKEGRTSASRASRCARSWRRTSNVRTSGPSRASSPAGEVAHGRQAAPNANAPTLGHAHRVLPLAPTAVAGRATNHATVPSPRRRNGRGCTVPAHSSIGMPPVPSVPSARPSLTRRGAQRPGAAGRTDAATAAIDPRLFPRGRGGAGPGGASTLARSAAVHARAHTSANPDRRLREGPAAPVARRVGARKPIAASRKVAETTARKVVPSSEAPHKEPANTALHTGTSGRGVLPPITFEARSSSARIHPHAPWTVLRRGGCSWVVPFLSLPFRSLPALPVFLLCLLLVRHERPSMPDQKQT